MADQTRQSFKWTERRYTLNEIEEHYKAKLPQIVLVAEGYSSSNSPYSISSSDMFFIKSIAKQPRLVVEDEKERLLSIPLDYSVKFHVVKKAKSGGISLGPSRKLREILHNNPLNTIKQLMLEMNESVSVLSGAEDAASGVLGVMTVQDIYYERYFLAHSLFNHAMMHPYQVEFPVYLPITVCLAIGLTMADDKKLAGVLSKAMELVTLDPDTEEAFDVCFSPDIMLFEERDDDGYEYVNPGGILDWAVKVERELETVERVYGASKTVDTRRRMKEQENWHRRRDPDPELLDIGVQTPKLNQTPSNAKNQLMLSDPFVKEIVERSESPPPPIPKRGQMSRRDKSVPLPHIPILKEEKHTTLGPFKEKDNHEEVPNETVKRRPSIDHEISPSHAGESLLHLALVDDGDDHPPHADLKPQAAYHPPISDKMPDKHSPLQRQVSDVNKIGSSPKQLSRGPKTAPKPSLGPVSTQSKAPQAPLKMQNTQNVSNIPASSGLALKVAPVEKSAPETESMTETERLTKKLSQSDNSQEDIQKVCSSSDSPEKSAVSRCSARRGQRPYSVAGGPTSHYDPTLYSRKENPYELETESLVVSKVRKPQKAEENQEHDYSYAVFPRVRLGGDGGNEVLPSATDVQKMVPKSSDIVQWADVPEDISTLTVGDVNACLRLLNLTTEVEDVDGAFLMELSEEELKDFFQMNGLQAKKLFKFSRGWRPKFCSS